MQRQAGESVQDFCEAMIRGQATFAWHLTRMWPMRHKDARMRQCVRDNIAGQRSRKEDLKREQATES